MATLNELQYGYDSNIDTNKVGTIESILSGVASGLIAIPKGFFSMEFFMEFFQGIFS